MNTRNTSATSGQKAILLVEPLEANLTRDTDTFGKMDPYVKIVTGGKTFKTKVLGSAGKRPVWKGEAFEIEVETAPEKRLNIPPLHIMVMDEDTCYDDEVGWVDLRPIDLMVNGPIDKWYDLVYRKKPAGKLRLRTTFDERNSANLQQQAAQIRNQVGGQNSGASKKSQGVQNYQPPGPFGMLHIQVSRARLIRNNNGGMMNQQQNSQPVVGLSVEGQRFATKKSFDSTSPSWQNTDAAHFKIKKTGNMIVDGDLTVKVIDTDYQDNMMEFAFGQIRLSALAMNGGSGQLVDLGDHMGQSVGAVYLIGTWSADASAQFYPKPDQDAEQRLSAKFGAAMGGQGGMMQQQQTAFQPPYAQNDLSIPAALPTMGRVGTQQPPMMNTTQQPQMMNNSHSMYQSQAQVQNNMAATMQQNQQQYHGMAPNTKEQAAQMVAQAIKQQSQGARSLTQFFAPYDWCKDRIFRNWELAEIFPTVNPEAFSVLARANNEVSRLRANEIEANWFKIQLDQTRLLLDMIDQPFETQSMYINKQASPDAVRILTELMKDREITHDVEQAWDTYFKGQKTINDQDIDLLCRRLSIQCGGQHHHGEVINFLTPSTTVFVASKINWKQGLLGFKEQQSKVQQPGMTHSQGSFHQQQYQPPSTNPEVFGATNAMAGMQQPMGGNQVTQNLQRLSNWLEQQKMQMTQLYSMQGKAVFPFDGTQAMDVPDFIQVLTMTPGVNWNQMDAQAAANQFMCNSSKMNMQGKQAVDTVAFEQALRNADQGAKYTQAVQAYSFEIQKIRDALNNRYTGAFKWFQTQSTNGNNLNLFDFNKAVTALNVPEVNDMSKQNLFNALHFNNVGYVLVSDIDGCFKAHAKLNRNSFSPDDVIFKILGAFNYDEGYIQTNLRQKKQQTNSLPLDQFVQWFGTFPNHQQHFKLQEVTQLAENYSDSRGEMDVDKFANDLFRVRTARNARPNQQPVGIHQGQMNQPMQSNPTGNNPFFTDEKADGTATQKKMGVQRPYNFNPRMDAQLVQDLQMSAFIAGKDVETLFSAYARPQGQSNYSAPQTMAINRSDFGVATQQAACLWNMRNAENFFQEVDRCFNNSAAGLIMPSDIDQFVHFTAEKTLQQIHDAILKKMNDSLGRTRQVNWLQEFEAVLGRDRAVCSVMDLQSIFSKLGQFSQMELSFVGKRYVKGATDDIHFRSMIDDLIQQSRKSTLHLGGGLMSPAGSHKSTSDICDAIRKKLYALDRHLKDFLGGGRGSSMYQQNFVEEFGNRLELVPEFCSENNLIEVWRAVEMGRGQVGSEDVLRYIESQSIKQPVALRDDVLKQIQQSGSNVMQVFNQNQDYVMNRSGKIRGYTFVDILMRGLHMSKIDAEFIARFYRDTMSDETDANRFINDCTNPAGASRDGAKSTLQNCREVLKKIAGIISGQRIELSQIFGAYSRGYGSTSIRTEDFFMELNKIMPGQLSRQDQETLSLTYSSDSSRSAIDYNRFLDDVRQVMSTTNQQAIALTSDQAKLSGEMAKMFKFGEAEQSLANNFKSLDTMNSGYLSYSHVKQGIYRTINAVPKIQKHAANATSDNKVNKLLATVEINSSGDYSWKKLLIQFFGADAGELYFTRANSGSARGNGGSKSGFVMPTAVSAAVNNLLGNIGQNIIRAYRPERENHEQIFQRKLGPSTNYKMTEMELTNVLQEIGVQLQQDEQLAMRQWVSGNIDQERKVDVRVFLKSVGLPPQTLKQAKRLPARVLTDQELRRCQDLLFMVRREIHSRNLQPKQVIDKYRVRATDKDMLPQHFKAALHKEVSAQLKQQLVDTEIKNLIHYLVRDEPGLVSFQKLYLALELAENAQPLHQDGVEDLKKYSKEVGAQMNNAKIPISVIELNQFMKDKHLSQQTMFNLLMGQNTIDMPTPDFNSFLAKAGFVPKDPERLIMDLDGSGGSRTKVSMKKLNDYLKSLMNLNGGANQVNVRDRYGNFDAATRQKIQQICKYCQSNNISTQNLHEMLDADKNGVVDKSEFTTGLSNMRIPGLTVKDFSQIFDQIDVNRDGFLSINEFGLFIQGAKVQREQRLNAIDPQTDQEITAKIRELFMQFDKNGDGKVEPWEIVQSMKALGTPIDLKRAEEMVATVDRDGDRAISVDEFIQLMKPIMFEKLVSSEQNIEDLRALFMEADIDYSGFLTVDELYACLLKTGLNMSIEELVELMSEFDIDKDAKLDVDEFTTLMSCGDEIQFTKESSKSSYMKIQSSRKLNIMDFLKAFGEMPVSFVPSFIGEKWIKQRKCLPSQGFKVQIDPRTMLWKDILPLLTDSLNADQVKAGVQPKLRSFESSISAIITLNGIEGVPLPKATESFDRAQICKRAVRIGLYDTEAKDFIHNSVQVNATWRPETEDAWFFNDVDDAGLNPVIFRTTQESALDLSKIWVVFELVIYVKMKADSIETSEISCGWAKVELEGLKKDVSKMKLELLGGSPSAQVAIQKTDVHTERKGFNMKSISKFFGGDIKSAISVSIKPTTSLPKLDQMHLSLMPQTCFFHKHLLYFMSGARNLAGDKLLKVTNGSFKKPSGSVTLSSLPKILDNPDIMEQLVLYWYEDAHQQFDTNQKKNFGYLMARTKDFIHRLYIVLYSDEMNISLTNFSASACGDPAKFETRKKLIKSALRFNNPLLKSSVKETAPPESYTTFKPFNVREIEYDVWDTHQAKTDAILRQYDDMGVLAGGRPASPQRFHDPNANIPMNR